MLSLQVKQAIEKDYGITIQAIRYLSKGFNGSVYHVLPQATPKDPDSVGFCVKEMPLSNETYHHDFKAYKIMYGHQFNFKSYTQHDAKLNFFTMPFFPGSCLEHTVKQQKLDVRTRLSIFYKLCELTTRMHSLGIIHRDLKADNVMVKITADGGLLVNIIDFGRCCFVYEETGKPVSHVEQLDLPNHQNIFLTIYRWLCQKQTAPEYLSLFGRSDGVRMVGFRSDYYALGTMFREIIPEYEHLAEAVIHSDLISRTSAFYEFCDAVRFRIFLLNKKNGEDAFAFLEAYIKRSMLRHDREAWFKENVNVLLRILKIIGSLKLPMDKCLSLLMREIACGEGGKRSFGMLLAAHADEQVKRWYFRLKDKLDRGVEPLVRSGVGLFSYARVQVVASKPTTLDSRMAVNQPVSSPK